MAINIILRTVPPSILSLSLSGIGPDYATINLTLGVSSGTLYAVALPDGATAPSAADIVAYASSPISGVDGWSGNGTIVDTGSGSVIYMPGINGLQRGVDKIWDVYVMVKRADLSYSDVFSGTFTATNAAPLLVSTLPSHNWKTVSLTDNITMVFDQTITLGTGNIVLRDTDTNADAQTIAIGSCTRTTTNITNDTLVINPSDLTARKNYAVTVGANCVKNADASLSYAGISNYTTYAFRAGYAAGNASTILGADTPAFAFDLTDNTCKIAGTGAYDGTFSSKFTVAGTLTKSETGMRFSYANNAKLATSAFGYSSTAGTLILMLSAQDKDTGAGTVVNTNNFAGFQKSSTQSNAALHYLAMSKSDSGGRDSELQYMGRNETAGAQGTSLASLSLPKGGTFGAVGMTWNTTDIIIATPTEAATFTFTLGLPDDMLEFFLGTLNTDLFYVDIKSGLYLASRITEAALQTRLSTFDDFRTA
jgi:hypothetical protein